MTTVGGNIRVTTGAMALALVLAPVAVSAQAVNDYRLPGTVTTSEPARPAPGPVDSDAPTVRTPAPRPGADAAPAAASPAATPRASAVPAIQRRAPRREEAARPAPAPLPTPSSTPQPAPASSPAAALPLPTATPTASSTPLPPPVLVEPAAPSADGSWLWPWGAALLALFGAVAGYALWRRRAARQLAPHFEPPIVTPPAPKPDPGPEPVAAPTPVPAPAPTVPEGLTMTLEARRMSASLMATTLSYTLRLTNHGKEPLSALAVEGDMIAAHGSIPPEQQIAQDGQRLELRHALVELAPGDSVEFNGDFRLPLSAVTPIRAGTAAYFVPLARFRVEAGDANGALQVLVQTYVVGEMAENPGAALRPFRLDLGPRTYSRIGERAVG